MKNKDLLRKLQNSYEFIILLIGVFAIVSSFFLLWSNVKYKEFFSTICCNFGGILIPAAIYRIIEKYINKLDKPYVIREHLDRNKIDKFIVKKDDAPLEYVHIGTFNELIGNKEYAFSRLVGTDEYIGKTVLIIGTTLSFFNDTDGDDFKALKDGCKKGIHFRLVITDPYSTYMTGEEIKGKKEIIEKSIKNIITIKNSESDLEGSIELRISPIVDKLHSFSLFDNGRNRIITLDYNFMKKGNDNKFSQMFYDMRLIGNHINTLSDALVEYYEDQFKNAIPYIKIASGSIKQKIKVFIVMNGKILLDKKAWKEKYKKKYKEKIFGIFPSIAIDYTSEDKVLFQILQELFSENQSLEKSPIQFLKAFQPEEGDNKPNDEICLVGEIINNRFGGKSGNELKENYDFFNKTEKNENDGSVDDFIGNKCNMFEQKVWDYIGTIN